MSALKNGGALPKSVGIIMDGNGRWAKERGLKRSDGHKKGASVVREISIFCAKKGVESLILYAFSTENWQRPRAEVGFLMRLLEEYLRSESATYMENNLRFRAIGDTSQFSKKLQKLIVDLEKKTAKNTGMTQILALNYGGKNELARAVKKAAMCGNLAALDDASVENLIAQNLDARLSLDMLIRTGGEVRISNFLLWQAAYSEMFFTPTLFPDFGVAELETMFEAFSHRTRRYGGL